MIRDIADFDYHDEIRAIDRQVKEDAQYADSRSANDIELGIPDSKGLLTFEQTTNSGKVRCWLPKSILQYFINNNIPVHFGKRTSGSNWDRNGSQWSEVEHLTLFPGTEDEFDYEIVVHTSERADGSIPNTYTSGDTAERVSAKQIIKGLDRRLRKEGLLPES